ncbi:ATP synthase F1 subunit epsilon [Candidatus Uhrbacteria bacterium CG10_big_fil_rev_8_21_14_0_10_48_11]|uniref:ATP synthase epsilon chain n=1 Tax=Candidatus Uhrbacteria bacterium CG10_big_fil_rev_8_21_14_0_10_48_11 TaxID=1975037 RepID=A0A2M8LF16_9BACT|nr:MAG: ATP synthase F1 subunit epsilon [Candidatus Uhrbacteria bacterium CG10_big_fil_rev_8_21_14_0_10_48_11]
MVKVTFEIATPEKIVYRESVDQVTVPTLLGEITILPNHIPLVSALSPGELVIQRGEDRISLFVSGGFIEVKPGSNVVVLADAAEHVDEIDVERAEAAKERARKTMETARVETEHYTNAAAELQRSLARLHLASRKRHRGRHGVGSEGTLKDS